MFTRRFIQHVTAASVVVAASATVALARGPYGTPIVPAEPESATVQLAICLDTSGSMDGLIDAAKQKLWAIVNDLALAEPTPRLEVALVTFGNDGHDAEAGWVAIQTPFTNDLDLVSQKLFALRTNGGTEYVGRVLRKANDLDWQPSAGVLRLIIVAGNESADQDEAVPFRDQCRKLIARDIMVNSIYCGPATDELAPVWKEIATLADGRFASIDQNNGTIVIETPFDEQLGALSASLNTTYLPFGAAGLAGFENQSAQDANAAGLNTAAVAARCQAKGSALYSCGWDLVDASAGAEFKLEDVETKDLPEPMQAMTIEDRRAHIAEKAGERKRLQAEIADVTKQREAFIQAELMRGEFDDSSAFDNAIRVAIREQAAAKGFTFAK